MSAFSGSKRIIKKVAVLGSGVMGSRIACHFANIGVEVLLLDIKPNELNADEQAKGLNLDHPAVKNRIVNQALAAAIKSNPSPLYLSRFASRIKTGNLTDDLAQVASCDWVLEAVVENLPIKAALYAQVEQFRKPGSLITSNTSGIPIQFLTKGRSEDFQQNFCGTHFFNPPRYLKLLEIIPGPATKPEVVDFLMHFGDLHLGKTTVLCKDTPAFIANRIGIFGIMDTIRIMNELDLSVSEIDKLTGPVLGRPKSATFRTSDVVGLDTLTKVASNLAMALTQDASKEVFNVPEMLTKMEANKWLGDKTGQGFYKKTKSATGETQILALNLKTFEYEEAPKAKFATLEATKTIDSLAARIPVLAAGTDKAGLFYKKMFAGTFQYVAARIPEISDTIFAIDDALCAGFGWEMGPFAMWDAFGFDNGIQLAKESGYTLPDWVLKMESDGLLSFYKVEEGIKQVYNPLREVYEPISTLQNFIILDSKRSKSKIWGNSGTTLHDLGDGITGLEFHTKMNTIGSEVIEGVHTAIAKTEQDFAGLVIANEGPNFSAGANLGLVFMYAIEQDFDEIDFMVRQFQNTCMRLRYSAVPVVLAPHHLTLGGACEMALHADAVQAYAETYIGLVELGVGVIPGGGGTKEMALRASDMIENGDTELNLLQNVFMNIATAKVATSAQEAFDLKYMRRGDGISLNQNRLIKDAKQLCLDLAEKGYIQPTPRTDIKVQGKASLALFKAGINGMLKGNYITPHDAKIADKLAYVISGGDLSYPQLVSEQYLLDLEREAFVSLCGEKKTLQRIESVLKGGKPLRN